MALAAMPTQEPIGPKGDSGQSISPFEADCAKTGALLQRANRHVSHRTSPDPTKEAPKVLATASTSGLG